MRTTGMVQAAVPGGGDVVDLVSTTFIIIIDLLRSHVRIVSTTEQLKMKL